MSIASPNARGILVGILVGAMAIGAAPAVDTDTRDVIVRGTDLEAVAAAVESHGGEVELEIGLIDAVSATVPTATLAALRADARVTDVTNDGSVTLSAKNDADDASAAGVTPAEAVAELGGEALLASEYDGTGVDVAVIDSGVKAQKGLKGDRLEEGVNVSWDDSGNRDGYGHGTVMASIIAMDHPTYQGVAPDARVIDVKVADRDGIADISQVLAGIDWVVSNRDTDGRNIRVLNLSFGTDGTNPYDTSPLAYAVEAAWRHGIVVVVSAGNHGDELGRLTSPAIDPFVIAVGAADLHATNDPTDDSVPDWSSAGDGVRNPDIVAPGRSILGARSKKSSIDEDNKRARRGEMIVGSGTSQAAAFTTGVVAAMLEANPTLSPDQVKAMLVRTARDLVDVPTTKDGAGVLDLGALFPDGALIAAPADATQEFAWSDGSGSLDGDRGRFVLEDANGNLLTGENTVLGEFDRDAWLGSTWSGSTWSGSTWSGSTWSGSTWSGSTWSVSTWSGSTWSASTWSASTWSASTWSVSTWSNVIWG